MVTVSIFIINKIQRTCNTLIKSVKSNDIWKQNLLTKIMYFLTILLLSNQLERIHENNIQE